MGCVLIKSTLGLGENPEGVEDGGEGCVGTMGDKKGQFTSNLGRGRTVPVTAGGRQVSGFGDIKGKCYVQNTYLCRTNVE